MVATRSSKSATVVTLDKDSPFQVHYLAEGAANVVFEIWSKRGILAKDDDFAQPGTITADGTPSIDQRLKGKLLRLRKDLPSVAPVLESHRHFEEQLKPLFPAGSLLEQLLCEITPGFVAKANHELHGLEAAGLRPKKRHGVYIAEDEPYATAITSMLWDDGHASCEFKPKWLAQSPSAPPGSKRCRTCALRAMRQTKDRRPPQRGDFCPLALLADDDQDTLSSPLDSILSGSRGAPLNILDFARQLRPYFHQNPLIKLLRNLQIEKDPRGILQTDPSNLDFMTAMTLRDCTMFLKIPNRDDTDAQSDVRLGDLDLKTPDGNKAAYWKDTERQLIDEGWYTATETATTDIHAVPCWLSRRQQ
ncbi:MAG: hypothetical protein Q9184_000819 [Pyrenodesmia sp. 2 TL-2023]